MTAAMGTVVLRDVTLYKSVNCSKFRVMYHKILVINDYSNLP